MTRMLLFLLCGLPVAGVPLGYPALLVISARRRRSPARCDTSLCSVLVLVPVCGGAVFPRSPQHTFLALMTAAAVGLKVFFVPPPSLWKMNDFASLKS